MKKQDLNISRRLGILLKVEARLRALKATMIVSDEDKCNFDAYDEMDDCINWLEDISDDDLLKLCIDDPIMC